MYKKENILNRRLFETPNRPLKWEKSSELVELLKVGVYCRARNIPYQRLKKYSQLSSTCYIDKLGYEYNRIILLTLL